jgi:hypothetical protein
MTLNLFAGGIKHRQVIYKVKCMSGPGTCQEVSLGSTNFVDVFLGP